jgi:peptide chain release factor 2
VSESWKHGGYFDLDRKSTQAASLRLEMNEPTFWGDRERAVEVSQTAESLEQEVSSWKNLLDDVRQLEELIALSSEQEDMSLEEESNKQFTLLQKRFQELEFFILFSGPYDTSSAIISLHAGTGGVDAQDWTQMLERMYLRFAENHNWKTEIIDRTMGNEAGVKSVTFNIKGRQAYGYLKAEAGVHRLVRISPFDSEGMRHTSFALVEVLPELPDDAGIEIRPEDLKVDFFRSSGPGGQNVNKTSSAVRLLHIPTGIVVATQTERSQHQNRELAMKILRAKLQQLQVNNRAEENSVLRGKYEKAAWGKQIRSYVLQPYQLVKDHRTGYEETNVEAILNGAIEGFIEAYLRNKAGC